MDENSSVALAYDDERGCATLVARRGTCGVAVDLSLHDLRNLLRTGERVLGMIECRVARVWVARPVCGITWHLVAADGPGRLCGWTLCGLSLDGGSAYPFVGGIEQLDLLDACRRCKRSAARLLRGLDT